MVRPVIEKKLNEINTKFRMVIMPTCTHICMLIASTGLMSTGLIFQSAFCQPCKFMTGEIVWDLISSWDLVLLPLYVYYHSAVKVIFS